MNLKNNQITMKEVLANPAAKTMLNKRFPHVMNHPLASAAGTLTLAQVIEFAKVYVPQSTINDLVRDLQKL